MYRIFYRTAVASKSYPQANGQAESRNKIILPNVKIRLEAKKGNWPNQLFKTLWTYRMSVRDSNQATLFSLVYGTEAVIPTEYIIPTARSKVLNKKD